PRFFTPCSVSSTVPPGDDDQAEPGIRNAARTGIMEDFMVGRNGSFKGCRWMPHAAPGRGGIAAGLQGELPRLRAVSPDGGTRSADHLVPCGRLLRRRLPVARPRESGR